MPNFDVSEPGPPELRPRAVTITVRGRVQPEDREPACAALRAGLAAATGGLVICDVASVARSDIGTVDLIARLALTAQGNGCRLVLRGAPAELLSLVRFAGLADALPCLEDAPPDSGLEPKR